MNKEDYFKYYIQGSDHYLIPKDEFIELFNEMSNWREEAKELKKQLKYLRSGEYYNQLRFENEMLQQVVDTNGVPSEVYDYIDCTHRNTELLKENQELKKQLEEYKLITIDYQELEARNQELKKKYENAVADYESVMFEKEQLNSLVNSCQEEIRQLKKQVEEYKDNYNCLLKQKEQFEYIMSKQVDYQGQRKAFINYLEDKIKSYKSRDSYMVADILGSYDLNNIELELVEEILQKYKEIIGGKE